MNHICLSSQTFPITKSTGDYRQAEVKALLARQVGRRHQGVGEGWPVLRRHLEENEGESRPPEANCLS